LRSQSCTKFIHLSYVNGEPLVGALGSDSVYIIHSCDSLCNRTTENHLKSAEQFNYIKIRGHYTDNNNNGEQDFGGIIDIYEWKCQEDEFNSDIINNYCLLSHLDLNKSITNVIFYGKKRKSRLQILKNTTNKISHLHIENDYIVTLDDTKNVNESKCLHIHDSLKLYDKSKITKRALRCKLYGIMPFGLATLFSG
ncbi:unnamed protein product, partial [Didymodactylos carnosus]